MQNLNWDGRNFQFNRALALREHLTAKGTNTYTCLVIDMTSMLAGGTASAKRNIGSLYKLRKYGRQTGIRAMVGAARSGRSDYSRIRPSDQISKIACSGWKEPHLPPRISGGVRDCIG